MRLAFLRASNPEHLTLDSRSGPKSIVRISAQNSSACSLEASTDTTDSATAYHQKSNLSLNGTLSSRTNVAAIYRPRQTPSLADIARHGTMIELMALEVNRVDVCSQGCAS